MNHAVRDKTTGRFVKQDWEKGSEVSPMWEPFSGFGGKNMNMNFHKTETPPPAPSTPNDSYDLWLHIVGYGAYLGLIAIVAAISAYIGAHWR